MNRETNAFVIVRYVEDKRFGADIGHGPLIRLSVQEMRHSGFSKMSQCFEEYMRLDCAEESEIKRMSDEQKKEFERKHKLMSVCLQRDSELWLDPMRVTKAGWKGHASLGLEFRTVLKLPISDEEFFAAIVRAFEKAP